jgi:2-amino-4-hydroxy-6-hydroxymethyldihydropteridine diphosphokinase
LKKVYLSLGSNVGAREANLKAAVRGLEAARVNVLRASPVYETEPMENTKQAWFLNLVIEGETKLMPLQLLERTLRIERDLGRVRRIPKGPRIIDIDILLFGHTVMNSKELEIPHPRMTERRFVLVPLADLDPGIRHPLTGKTVLEMLDAAPPGIVRPAKK